MPSILDSTDDPAKILLIGENGSGKTGAKASLVASGYKLRIIDTDKGFRVLRSLLTDPRYPYANWIKKKGIDLASAVSYVPIDTEMSLRTVTRRVGDKNLSETILAPKDARAWMKIIQMLENWNDGESKLGPVTSWEPDTILDLDTLSTIAMNAFYFIQSLNGHLGASESGNEWGRDIAGAQSQLRRLLEMLSNSVIRCNVIINSHITKIDQTTGTIQSPEQRVRTNPTAVIDPRGYPSAIGRALSTQIGKYFNDVYVVKQSGSGMNVRREISTVPASIDNVTISAKNSVYLERSYDISTGLAEIFAALRRKELEPEMLAMLKTKPGGQK